MMACYEFCGPQITYPPSSEKLEQVHFQFSSHVPFEVKLWQSTQRISSFIIQLDSTSTIPTTTAALVLRYEIAVHSLLVQLHCVFTSCNPCCYHSSSTVIKALSSRMIVLRQRHILHYTRLYRTIVEVTLTLSERAHVQRIKSSLG